MNPNETTEAALHPHGSSRFIRACLRQPVDRTPIWLLRQAGRYMPEYMAVRKHHSLLDICRTPEIAAEVTITAAERLGVDAAIIFADLLLPFTPMGLDFEFVNGEGPVVHQPIRSLEHIEALRTDRTDDLRYVAQAIEKVGQHFNQPRPDGDQLGIIGFIGAPFTLASYMIEGGSSRNYVETKKLMYASGSGNNLGAPSSPTAPSLAKVGSRDAKAWPLLLEKLLTVLTDYAAQQVEAGADVIQIFDSWAGALSVTDYRDYCLHATTELVQRVKALGVPVIYFGVDTASLLPTMRETGADVLGLDWRIPLDEGWRAIGYGTAVQGNLDPITLFAPQDVLEARVKEILDLAANRNGHIFNLGHGIVPGTPVENVIHVVDVVKKYSLREAAVAK
ncbi:uroporphyrinogen decarboxylase [Granulicella sp. 5B5]|uniref:uroporphyrinogen decarboxylase n=1 Tax=Granulicella sp. 5B5 TaxID=1617967 RepID=UPI00210652EB|nr:uroporphyrinogen decarboxylase [Granulicella sp. 5B5]